MTDAIIKRAWKGEPPPPDCEPIPFLCLRAVYRECRRGTLDRDTAEWLKERCTTFDKLSYKERRALMIYALGSEFECKGRLEDIEILTWELVKGTG